MKQGRVFHVWGASGQDATRMCIYRKITRHLYIAFQSNYTWFLRIFDCEMFLFTKFLLFFWQGGESEHINLKVLGQDNAVVQFKIKKHTPLRKLMNAYCDRAVSKIYLFFLLKNKTWKQKNPPISGIINASRPIQIRRTTN